MTSMLCPFFSAWTRTNARTAEVILASTVSGIFSTPVPPGDIMMGPPRR